jgi:hypothetical protein
MIVFYIRRRKKKKNRWKGISFYILFLLFFFLSNTSERDSNSRHIYTSLDRIHPGVLIESGCTFLFFDQGLSICHNLNKKQIHNTQLDK